MPRTEETKPGVVAHAFNLWVPGQSSVHSSQFQTSQGYTVRPYLEKKEKNKNKNRGNNVYSQAVEG